MRRRIEGGRLAARQRPGQALLEFAAVAFVLTFLLGAMLTFGFLFFGANVLQQAADVGAMELARHPAPANQTFDDALEASGLFDESQLVVAVGTPASDLPLINRLLFPLYIYDPDVDMLRYPGALAVKTGGASTVLIPILAPPTSPTASQTIDRWAKVVEEITPPGEAEGAYSLNSTTTGGLPAGTVALRINYPFQSGAMIAYRQSDGDGDYVPLTEALGQDGTTNVPVPAVDGTITSNQPVPAGYTLMTPSMNADFQAGTHRGEYGLGEVQAFATLVRPYRKVLFGQAIYRREVVE